ncbi:hypothetical protein [Novilysobacter selenitireducens]|uniref:Outer membrane protein beta-barrel domain-containing protein n=1 Tax=Novilysobacter selenitireducens TaxID=2872639 RepID=A0ABS7T5F6_9GAMM|nr:hypothetical protein [Lysobacter selenitireducens]MBZ4039110.1 hypothetical protein [Lysobacter selenitireducens]
MKRTIPRGLDAFPLMLLLAWPCAANAHGGDWDWMVEPYAWGASIGTDLETFQPPTDVDNETSFSDVIDKLDGVIQARVEGRGDRFGAFVDFTYLGLGDEKQRRVLSTETDLDTRLLDAAVSWRPAGRRDTGLDVFAGLRYIDVDVTARFRPDDPAFATRVLDGSRSYSDFLFGGRYTWRFSERWGMTVRGDVSAGDTEGTWGTSLMGHYFTRNGMWLFGYRYLAVELGNDNIDTEVRMSGPQVGYGFRF